MVENPDSHYKKESVAESYDSIRFTSLAGRSFDKLEKHNIRKAFSDVERDSLILDAPCGTGRLAEALLEEGFRVVGMDISEQMLKVAQKKLAVFGDRFTTEAIDIRSPRKSDIGRFDAALCARVLMHFPLDEQITLLSNVSRLTRGKVVFTHSWSSPYQRRRRGIKKILGNQPPVLYPISRTNMNELLTKTGLKELRRIRPMPLITEEIIVVACPKASRSSTA